jgi:hypothetical protein
MHLGLKLRALCTSPWVPSVLSRDAPRQATWEVSVSEGKNRGRNFAYDSNFRVNPGIFNMPQIYDMGQTALLLFRRKACWGFSARKNIRRLWPSLNPRTRVLEASMLTTRPPKPLNCTEHDVRLCCVKQEYPFFARSVSGFIVKVGRDIGYA